MKNTKNANKSTPRKKENYSLNSDSSMTKERAMEWFKTEYKAQVNTTTPNTGRTLSACSNAMKAIKFFEAAAATDSDAQCCLGLLYATGCGNAFLIPNEKAGMKMLQEAGEKGHIGAAYCLGTLYETKRRKDDADEKEAVKWLKKAAEGGHPGALRNLGKRYQQGRGVEKDEKAALACFEEAKQKEFKHEVQGDENDKTKSLLSPRLGPKEDEAKSGGIMALFSPIRKGKRSLEEEELENPKPRMLLSLLSPKIERRSEENKKISMGRCYSPKTSQRREEIPAFTLENANSSSGEEKQKGPGNEAPGDKKDNEEKTSDLTALLSPIRKNNPSMAEVRNSQFCKRYATFTLTRESPLKDSILEHRGNDDNRKKELTSSLPPEFFNRMERAKASGERSSEDSKAPGMGGGFSSKKSHLREDISTLPLSSSSSMKDPISRNSRKNSVSRNSRPRASYGTMKIEKESPKNTFFSPCAMDDHIKNELSNSVPSELFNRKMP